ncbi:MAG: DUF1513 domain-containing protein [Pseudomonadota bacterium]
MPSRRGFLAGLAASALAPTPSWADVGQPHYLAAARATDGRYMLHGLDAAGAITFSQALPGRGHAAAAHPRLPQAVAFARRPGTFALVMDCRGSGQVVATLAAPPGRHFYGHGAFSRDGTLLFTSESDYEAAEGRIGIWDATEAYRRIGEIPTYGTGPHELLRLPGSDTLVVANGGIETHPETGRLKLNLGSMAPSLAYVSPQGALLDHVTLDPAWHKQSIRHLAARQDGLIAAACQWQGEIHETPPLLLTHRQGGPVTLMQATTEDHEAMNGYAGSVAFSGDGSRVAITSPRGGRVQVFDAARGAHLHTLLQDDACGVATAEGNGLYLSSGTGVLGRLDASGFDAHAQLPVHWDNHLVALPRDRS